MSEKSSGLNPLPVLAGAVVFIIVIVLFFGDRETPVKVTRERLAVLENAVRGFAEEQGRAPDALSELGLPEEALADHLGEPFMYSVTNGVATILSYGSDKKPGGLFFKKDYKAVVDLRE